MKNNYFAVDTDPHFIINLPISQTDVCFNVDAQAGNMLNLLTDTELGKCNQSVFKKYTVCIAFYCRMGSVIIQSTFLSAALGFIK